MTKCALLNIRFILYLLAVPAIAVITGGPLSAQPLNTTVPPIYTTIAESFSIDPIVVYAIAKQESNHDLKRRGYRRSYHPWPWTLNIQGTPYRFNTRQQALDKLRIEINRTNNIDIGLMQLNWRWHHHRFSSIEQALDPVANVMAGTAYLAELSAQHGIWKAIGYYHNLKDTVADNYRNSVKRHLLRLLNRPAMASETSSDRTRLLAQTSSVDHE